MELGPLQKKWVKALRSGKYQQSDSGFLCEVLPDGKKAYCCLGVAAEVVLKLEKRKKAGYFIFGTGSSSFLEEFEALGLRSKLGRIEDPRSTSRPSALAMLNDNRGWSFEKIADYIEKHPKQVFTKSV